MLSSTAFNIVWCLYAFHIVWCLYAFNIVWYLYAEEYISLSFFLCPPVTALLFKMEEANIANRAKAQEFIQATSQVSLQWVFKQLLYFCSTVLCV